MYEVKKVFLFGSGRSTTAYTTDTLVSARTFLKTLVRLREQLGHDIEFISDDRLIIRQPDSGAFQYSIERTSES